MVCHVLNARSMTMADQVRSGKIARGFRVAITTGVAIAAIVLGVWAFRFYEYTPWTRDGRVSVYVVDSAPDISGEVTSVPVQDNQFVHKGDLLYTIDPRDYESAVQRAQSTLDAAKAQLVQQQEESVRRQTLPSGAVSIEQKQIYATDANIGQADVEGDEAALYKAKTDLQRCQIRSPVNGWVTNLTVRAGNYANTGQRQMSVVDADSFWISGYFEETQLRNIQIGASARTVLMGYPDQSLIGHVESIGRGIDDTDATPDSQGLPQVSPIFTWVRLAQRIPVRIHIDAVPEKVHLSAGETCTIYIHSPMSP